MKKLSLVIASRNDSYNSKYTTPLFRLQTSLERTLHNAGDTDLEIIIVDYGSDEKIEDCLGIDDKRLRFIYIDKEECEKYDTPFNEVKCINRGARNSIGDFIGRIDQDTIVGKRFFDWFNEGNLSEGEFYFGGRRELPMGEYTEQDDAVYVTPGGRGQSAYWKAAVGVLLIPRNIYLETRGYDERNILFNHMEHEFIARISQRISLVNLGRELNIPFYHLFHETSDSDTRKENPRNPNRNRSRVKQIDLGCMSYAYVANLESWG
jgi:hypothetical protein